METVFDVETKVTDDSPSPYKPENYLVTVNICVGDTKLCVFFKHDTQPPTPNGREIVQGYLDRATLFIAHNAKFDLSWLLECGFNIDCDIYDTMLYEYVHSRGLRRKLTLNNSLARHGLKGKKDLIGDTLRAGGTVQGIDPIELKEYGLDDAYLTFKLYKKQIAQYGEVSWCKYWANNSLLKTLQMDSGLLTVVKAMNSFLPVLVEMERNGLKLDLDYLHSLKTEYTDRLAYLNSSLHSLILKHFGPTLNINLNSPTDLSTLLYSRKPISRRIWTREFVSAPKEGKWKSKLGVAAFQTRVHQLSQLQYIQKQTVCLQCHGSGISTTGQHTKSGTLRKHPLRCTNCSGNGYTEMPTGTILGFNLPIPYLGTSANGFIVDKVQIGRLRTHLEHKLSMREQEDQESSALLQGQTGEPKQKTNTLMGGSKKLLIAEGQSKQKGSGKHCDSKKKYFIGTGGLLDDSLKFLTNLAERNSISTYLNTFVESMLKFHEQGILHPNFNQNVTLTGRLSSSKPNLQNLPRDRTFPVRGAVVSRFKGGKIGECDYAQLEFRVAVALSGDKQGIEDILAGVDKHKFTADILTQSKQPTGRQEAKQHTFKPLYGGSSGTVAEKAYYAAFAERHSGIIDWHDELCTAAVNDKEISIPSGRVYRFPRAYVTNSGYVNDSTRIKNYPVQGFATADVVPLALTLLYREMKRRKMKSLMVLTVHDCVVIDIHPDEIDTIMRLVLEVFTVLTPKYIEENWGFVFNVPIDAEAMLGASWLKMEEVHGD